MIAPESPAAFASRFRLDGELAVVTGAGRGIGRGCALALASAGAKIVAIGRTREELDSLADEIAVAGGECRIAPCDVCDRGAINALFAEMPAPGVLVNNAGANVPQPTLEIDEATFDRLFALNVKAAFFTAQAAARRMREAGTRGSIINMSSQAGHVALRNRAVYCATKHALEGFTKVMAVELAPFGIRVNTVAPTFIETPMTKDFLADGDFADYVRANIPLGQVGVVADVEGAVIYLASAAARLVTGTSLRVDGGWTAQ